MQSKLFPLLRICSFLLIISPPAYAEYYIETVTPETSGMCVSCYRQEIVSATHTFAYGWDTKTTVNDVCAENMFSSCGCAEPQPTCGSGVYYDYAYPNYGDIFYLRSNESFYEDVETDFTWDQRTADDVGVEMDIDY